MRKGRWLAIGVASALVAAGTLLLYVVLSGSAVPFVPFLALGLYAVAPLAASWLSGHAAPIAAGAGGLALGIGAMLAAAAAHQGGTGAMPVALGIAVAGAIALDGNITTWWVRLGAVVLVAIYALYSARFVAVAFAYPLLGLADEFADVIVARRKRPSSQDPARI